MEKNDNIIKAMDICAKPGCSEACPYFDKRAGAKSCRSILLEEALAELVGLMADKETLNSEVNDLETVANAMRAERDAYANECKALTMEVNVLHERLRKAEDKTNRRSVCFDGNTAYWCGRADALAEVVGHMFEGEVPCK